jgi:hypothetical protein
MPPVQCFLIERTGTCTRYLRRYGRYDSQQPTCPAPDGYHNARVVLDVVPDQPDERGYYRGSDSDVPHDDPRWPTQCVCGYAFTDADEYQVFREHIYRRVDTGDETNLRDAPAGAMWRAEWYESIWKGPDGKCYVLRLPDGSDWVIDGPAANGPGWTRTGTAPHFTATPSIGSHFKTGPAVMSYHGWLRDGVLVDA